MAKENGRKITYQTVISMKEITIWIRNMDMVCSVGKVETFIKVITKKIFERAMVKCIGQMAKFIKANGKKGYSMVMDVYYFQMEGKKRVRLLEAYLWVWNLNQSK